MAACSTTPRIALPPVLVGQCDPLAGWELDDHRLRAAKRGNLFLDLALVLNEPKPLRVG
jgi:hypothetical protein